MAVETWARIPAATELRATSFVVFFRQTYQLERTFFLFVFGGDFRSFWVGAGVSCVAPAWVWWAWSFHCSTGLCSFSIGPLPFGLSFGPSLLGLSPLLPFGLFVSFEFPFSYFFGRFAV